MSNPARKQHPRMATIARPRPRTRIDNLRDIPVDRTVAGTPEEREKHQLETLEEWRPIREKSNTK
jgi:hypothetical protein